jgi:hypothetical protein
MPIQPASFHKDNFNIMRSLGTKRNAGDAMLVPRGFGNIGYLLKQFPQPHISGGQSIEVSGPGGLAYFEQAPIDTRFEGAVTFYETDSGAVKTFFSEVLAGSGFFDADLYEGTIDSHFRAYTLRRCFIKLDPSDRDHENKQQVLLLTGTMSFSYFGEERPGPLVP